MLSALGKSYPPVSDSGSLLLISGELIFSGDDEELSGGIPFGKKRRLPAGMDTLRVLCLQNDLQEWM